MRDEQLLKCWRDGDRNAGQILVKRHYDSLFMFFWGKVDEQTSADLVQDTFETLCTSQDRFRGDSSTRTYLFGIARWKLVDHLRKARKQRDRFDPLRDGIDEDRVERSITSLFAHRQQQALLVRGLRSLPLDDQLLLELKDYETLTARELAEVFGIPAGTMAGRISRARERLRRAVRALASNTPIADETLESLDSFFRGVRATVRDAHTRP
ncbi:MAG: sigma-70 family RNA polymerase sigma factor [Myxococcota bacterium]